MSYPSSARPMRDDDTAPIAIRDDDTAPIGAPVRLWAKPPLDATHDEPEEWASSHLEIPPVSRPAALSVFLWCWTVAGAAGLAGGVLPLLTDRAETLVEVRNRIGDAQLRPSEVEALAELSMTATSVVLALITVVFLTVGFLAWRGHPRARPVVTVLGWLVLAFHGGAAALHHLLPSVVEALGVSVPPARDVYGLMSVGFTSVALWSLWRRSVQSYQRELRFRSSLGSTG